MRINGNIELNALGQSEVQNLVVERVTSTPAFVSSEAGRVIYNSTESTYYMNNGTQWITLATGGDAAQLENEVDAIEAAVGLATNGGFVPWSSTNFLNTATTIKDGVTKLDTALKAEEVSRNSADATLQSNISAEETRALAAEGVLQGNVDAEAASRTSADNLLQNAIDAEEARAKAAEGDLTALSTSAKADLVSAVNEVVTETDAAQAGLAADILTEKTRAEAAEGVLQNNIDAEQAARIAADDALTTRLDSGDAGLASHIAAQAIVDGNQDTQIGLKVAKAGDSMSGTLAMNGNAVTGVLTPVNSTDGVNKEYVDQLISGLKWKDPVRSANLIDDSLSADPASPNHGDTYILAGAGTGAWSAWTAGDIVQFDGSGWILVQSGPVATGDRFIVSGDTATLSGSGFTDNTIVVWNGTSFDAEVPVDQISVYVSDVDSVNFGQNFVYSAEDSNWIKFSGPAQVGAGVGLVYEGNIMHVGLGAGIFELPSDEVGIETYPASGLMLTADGSSETTDSAARLAIKRDGVSLTSSSAGIRVAQTILDDISANASAVAAESTRAGSAEGVLQGNIDAEALARTTADTALQGDIDTESAARSAADTALQGNIDAEAATRLANDTSLANDIATETSDRQAADAVIQSDVDANEAAINAKVDKMFYLYESASPATTHTIVHNIGQQFVNTSVYFSDTNEQIIPQSIVADSANQLTVTFNVAINAKVSVMGLA